MSIPYATQWINQEDIQAVSRALSSLYLTQGPLIAEFEARVAEYCKVKYAVALNSGTSALHAACFAAGINSGDEVITSPITFVASANCVLYCGGSPVFADIEPSSINIDPGEIENRITKRTKAIVPVHFSGHPCEMERIKAIARKQRLIIIEDAAHALGAEYKGHKVGSCTYSDMTILSFHAVKHITTGEGGMVLTNDQDIYNKLVIFRSHGITRDPKFLENISDGPWYYEMQYLGFNYRLTDFQCALGLEQLKRIDGFIERRRVIVNEYNRAFQDIDSLILPRQDAEGEISSWHLYVIQVKEGRDQLFKSLQKAGLGVNVHYIPVHLQPYYRRLGHRPGDYPRAESYYSRALTLPLFPKMSDNDVQYVIRSVRTSLGIKI